MPGRNRYLVRPKGSGEDQLVVGFASVLSIIGTLPSASNRRTSAAKPMTAHTAQIRVTEAGAHGVELNDYWVYLHHPPNEDRGITVTLQHLVAERSGGRRNPVPVSAPSVSVTSTGVVFSTAPTSMNNGPMSKKELPHGYQHVRIEMDGYPGQAYMVLAHRLVLTVHGEPYPADIPDAQCDHIDNNTANNDIMNLQWLSAQDHHAKTNHIPTDAHPLWNGDGKGWWYRKFWGLV
jgi:hypothetical protein